MIQNIIKDGDFFSVQKKISLEVGGNFNDDTEDKLRDRVGWRKEGNWLDYSDLTFNLVDF